MHTRHDPAHHHPLTHLLVHPLPTPGVPQGTPYRCPEYRTSSNAQTLAFETEAMEVYTKYFNEFYRVQFEGGGMEPTATIFDTTDGMLQ